MAYCIVYTTVLQHFNERRRPLLKTAYTQYIRQFKHSKHLGGKAIRVFDEIHGTHTRGE